jgi:hypothetical protein
MSLNERTSSAILSENPGLEVVRQQGRNLFYERPIGHILAGYFVDYDPISTYFGWVCVPLCDVVSHLGPGFGGRLPRPGGEIGDSVSAAELPKNLRYLIEQQRQNVNGLKETSSFLQHFSLSDSLNNEKLGRSYATVLIVNKAYDEAYNRLRLILSDSYSLTRRPDWMEGFLRDTELLVRALERKPSAAIDVVTSWTSTNKERFDILG